MIQKAQASYIQYRSSDHLNIPASKATLPEAVMAAEIQILPGYP